MLFLALRFFENQSSFALYSASLEPKLSCVALCFKPKFFLRCALLL